MDTLGGNYADHADEVDELSSYDLGVMEDDHEAPPAPVDADERRMQVRAYNYWAGLLDNRNFPAIEALVPANLPDFGPFSVLLDFSHGIDNPAIAYLGEKLAIECGTEGRTLATLADVPPRSLLSRITDHYMQILANQAPIGFEAEFVNQRGATILYRGILLPFSSDDETIDFIYGVINWKEMADQRTADALLLEIGQALDETEREDEDEVALRQDRKDAVPLTDWADGPAALLPGASPLAVKGSKTFDDEFEDFNGLSDDDVLDLVDEAELDDLDLPAGNHSRFGSLLNLSYSSSRHASSVASDYVPTGYGTDYSATLPHDVQSVGPDSDPAFDQPYFAPETMGLGDWLASARALADAFRHGEERTRASLYDAIGRAYDFSLAAIQDSEGFADLLADSGLEMQSRAPMTPVVKLVFGADYDKTRLTEYAAALSHAHRLGLEQGTLADYLHNAEGGLKGVVQIERRMRRLDNGLPEAPTAPRATTTKKLRAVTPKGFDAIPAEGPEFALVMLRRLGDGSVAVIGEVPDDVALVERAAKKLLG